MAVESKQSRTWDVIIIGAGVIGSSIALGLSRNGFKTLSVDTLPAAGYGSTSNSSGIIRPFYSAVESCALAHEARSRWLNWPEFVNCRDERGYAQYVECGMLMLMAEGDRLLFQNSFSAMQTVGVAFEYLQEEQLLKQFSCFDLASYGPPKSPQDSLFGVAGDGRISEGVFISDAGYVGDPQLAAHNLQRAAEATGAEFRFNTRIVSVDRYGGSVGGVTTGSGERLQSAIVVNVAGPHSSQINKMAGVSSEMRVPTRPMRHEVAHVPAPAGFVSGHRNCVVGDGDAGVYLRPDVGNNLLIGSLDPPCDQKDYVHADHYSKELTEQWTRQVWRAAQRIPDLCIPNTAQGLVGVYDATPDWIPVYDKSSLPGYYMAIGTSGNQFKNAPLIGELMTRLITVCESGQDHDTQAVNFHLPALDMTIDLGFFSRLRKSHARTSGTVLA